MGPDEQEDEQERMSKRVARQRAEEEAKASAWTTGGCGLGVLLFVLASPVVPVMLLAVCGWWCVCRCAVPRAGRCPARARSPGHCPTMARQAPGRSPGAAGGSGSWQWPGS